MAETRVDCSAEAIGAEVESQLDLRYAKRYDPLLAAILSQGEAERINALSKPFSALSREQRRALRQEWREILRKVFAGTLPNTFTGAAEPTFDTLRVTAPVMLARLKACGPQLDTRLAYMAEIELELFNGTNLE